MEASSNDILNNTPILRIGLTENKDIIEYKSTGRFSVYNNEGIAILKSVTSHSKWKIKVEQSYNAKYAYNILLGKFTDYEEAQELNYQLIEKGLGAQIKTFGDKLYYENKLINDNSIHWVLLDYFHSEDEARSFADKALSNFRYKIVKEKIKEPGAILEIFDAEYEKITEAENIIRIVPESEDVVSYLYDFSVEEGLPAKHSKYRAFRGIFEFRCSDAGKLIIIHEIPLERYIEGVIASEMKPEFPEEALKAQAIAIRSKAIAGLRIKHRNDPFDLCATAHCQAFTGESRASATIAKTVNDTIGQVLANSRDNIYDADHSLVCGGYTENPAILESEIINTSETSIYDTVDGEAEEKNPDLSNEGNFQKFIDLEPNVLCNYSGNPEFNQYQKYFRWEITQYRKELEEIISLKENKIIGVLYDIIPVKRSRSGRLTEIEIIASNVNLIIVGEMNIRKILSHHLLNSASFYITKEIDDDGIPISFSFRGAGVGHGVGLCQAGAVMMAKNGYKCEQILDHYFKGTHIKKIY